MPHVDKEGSINHMSSIKELNERDEDFDSSINSAFLNNVNLDSDYNFIYKKPIHHQIDEHHQPALKAF